MDNVEGTARPDDWLRWAMDHIEGQVGFGDTKAGLLLTADSILLAVLLAVGTSEQFGIDALSDLTAWFIAISFAILVAALLLALFTILPSWKNLWHPDLMHRNMTNFSAIASMDPASVFVEKVSDASFASLEQDAAYSVHGKAQWARRKFKLLFWAIALTQAAVVVGTLAAVVETVAR